MNAPLSDLRSAQTSGTSGWVDWTITLGSLRSDRARRSGVRWGRWVGRFTAGTRLRARGAAAAWVLAWALPLVASLALHAGSAQAQACCAGGASANRASWVEEARAFAGVEVSTRALRWADVGGRYVRLSGAEVELRQVFFAGGRATDALRMQVAVPLVQTRREVTGDAEWGGGVGDVTGALRWRPRGPSERDGWPGLEVEGRLTAPTGRSPQESVERGQSAWMTDVTGSGVWSPGFGLRTFRVLGQTYGEWSLALDWPTARETNAVSFRPGSFFSSMVLVGTPVARMGAQRRTLVLLSGSLGFEARGRVQVDGAPVAGTAERRTSVAAVTGVQWQRWYTSLRVGTDLPVQPLTREMSAGVITSWSLRYDLR